MKDRAAVSSSLRGALTKINMPAGASLFFTSANLLSKAAAFIFTPLFTRLLTGSEYGEYSLFSSILSVVLIIGSLELSSGVMQRCIQKHREQKNHAMLLAILLTSAIILLITPVIIYLNAKYARGLSFSGAYPSLAAVALSSNIINLYIAGCKFSYKWKPAMLIAAAQSILAPLLGIILIRSSRNGNIDHVGIKIGVIAAINTAIAISVLFFIIKGTLAERNIRKSATVCESGIRIIKSMLMLSLPLIPYYVSVGAISEADRLILSHALGTSELAKYSVAYSLGIAFSAITSGITSALCPWIMRKIRAGAHTEISPILNRLISLGAATVALGMTVFPEVFSILAPKEYSGALPIAFIAATIPLPIALTQCMTSVAIAKERTSYSILSGIISACVSVSLGYLIIPHSGILSAAIITAISYNLLLFLNVVKIRSFLKINLGFVNNYLQKLLLIIFFALIILQFANATEARIFFAFLALFAFAVSARSALSIVREKEIGAIS